MSLRDLPKVDILLEEPKIVESLKHYSRNLVTDRIREVLDEERKAFVEKREYTTDKEEIVNKVIEKLSYTYSLKPVINATGVVIHTNLGRSVLPEEVFEHVKEISTSYSNLEFNLDTGKRGSRYDHLVNILKELTGAEDAHVVNNNAAAVMLVLKALARDKEVIVSRGELVEIGGSFRIPDVMSISGTILKEVGTTNKTHAKDYVNAITDNTVMLMKVHQSNFYIEGFTSEVELEELSAIAKEKGLFLYEDMGSGYLTGSAVIKEHDLKERLKKVDLLSISGDKLLGSVQAGIILGKKELIEKLKKDQLTRALRVDKLTLSALEASLKLYLEKNGVGLPTLDFLNKSYEEILEASKELVEGLGIDFILEEGESLVGGGTLPKVRIKTPKIKLKVDNPQSFVDALRDLEKPIIATLQDGQVVLDLRAVFEKDIPLLKDSLKALKELV